MFPEYLGPSTPGDIAIVSAQAGETQYALHAREGYTGNGGSGAGRRTTKTSMPDD